METRVMPSNEYVGAGVGLRRIHQKQVLAGAGPAVLEIVPDHFFAAPHSVAAFAEQAQLVFHDVGLSLGTDGPLDASALDRLNRILELVEIARPLLFSDHLAATRTSTGLDLGHLCPIQYTTRTLDQIASKVSIVQDRLKVPVALENIASPFRLPGSEMSESEFFCALTRRTGCGLLLDVTNVLYDSRNQHFDPADAISQYPLDCVWQIHLAGGVERDHFWVDSHSRPVEAESLALLATLRRCVPLQCIIVERDEHLPALEALCIEAANADAVYRGIEVQSGFGVNL